MLAIRAGAILHQRALWLVALLLGLSGCLSHGALPSAASSAQWVPSANFDARRARLIVLHHTDMRSAQAALRTLRTRNLHGRVSAHYLIGRDGALYQLVADEARAWHAGVSRWGDITDLNSTSIGIELDFDSAQNDNGNPGYAPAQIERLIELLGELTARLDIPPQAVIGHGDIAPTRKRDPDIHFPWARLAEAGYGWWPRATLAPVPVGFDAWAALRLIGYDVRDPAAALRAFHRHFRGNEAEGWQAGDADILFDLQRQRMAMPEVDLQALPTPPDPSPDKSPETNPCSQSCVVPMAYGE